jgi:DNA polymerase-3 subunit alpha
MIGDIKTKLDKKGKRMAFVGIEDITGRTELVVFSDVYERSRIVLHPEKLVIARGRVSTKEGEKPKLVATEIYSVEEAYLRTPLSLTLTLNETERPLLEQALPLLEFGNWPGVLNLRVVTSDESLLSSSLKGGIKLSRELLENLRQFVGSERIAVSRDQKGGRIRTLPPSKAALSAHLEGNGGRGGWEVPY